jgi:hypothetical protein
MTTIRTDYRFASLEGKDRLLRFFFDAEILDTGVRDESFGSSEFTGMWRWGRDGSRSRHRER